MIKPPGIVFVVIGVMLVISAAMMLLSRVHTTQRLPLQIHGRLVDGEKGTPIEGAWVMAVPSRKWVEDSERLAVAAEVAREWNALQESDRYVPPGPSSAPSGAGGATTKSDGSFKVNLVTVWSGWRRWLSVARERRVPADRIKALVIEIEGRDPVILDMPEGTWTEHDGEDGLWATWDLGVVEVP